MGYYTGCIAAAEDAAEAEAEAEAAAAAVAAAVYNLPDSCLPQVS